VESTRIEQEGIATISEDALAARSPFLIIELQIDVLAHIRVVEHSIVKRMRLLVGLIQQVQNQNRGDDWSLWSIAGLQTVRQELL
jgi:hypothetical protein